MSVAVQDSLLDFGDEPAPGKLRPERVPLSHGAWIDVQRGWLTGSAALFGRLAERVPWKAERRRMYDRTVDVPRLLCFYGEDAALPDRALDACRDALNRHYRAELGEAFTTAGRGSTEDTMAAFVSRGGARPLVLRPRHGGSGDTQRYSLGHGDLIVMGGSCQRTWEHGGPKSARP